jgi:uncharacterized membrane protein
MPTWLIPAAYSGTALAAAFIIPRLEHAYFRSYLNDISVAEALAMLSSITSGMMALTAIVFSVAYITVQFSAIAYSPRLALWFSNDPRIFHAMGTFMATFLFALGVIAWVDRGADGGVPLVSTLIVLLLLVASMFHFVRLVRGFSDLQVTNTLQLIGDKGRTVIREMFPRVDDRASLGREDPRNAAEYAGLGAPARTLRYKGAPKSIGKLDMAALVEQARRAGSVIELACGAGDTLLDDALVLNIYGAAAPISEAELLRAIHLTPQRTFEQDPKYPIRLLVDIAIKALSPAINDPTTAVQAIDQIEDLLRHLGRRELDTGFVRDMEGALRLVVPMPTWEDYLRLSFDEIRQFGGRSVQVIRRLRSALAGVAEAVASETRTASVERYLKQLDLVVDRSPLDAEDRLVASQEDRQGLGLSRKRRAASDQTRTQAPPAAAPAALVTLPDAAARS